MFHCECSEKGFFLALDAKGRVNGKCPRCGKRMNKEKMTRK